MRKILLLSLLNRFLVRGANLPPPPVQIGCKNTPVYIGLKEECEATTVRDTKMSNWHLDSKAERSICFLLT